MSISTFTRLVSAVTFPFFVLEEQDFELGDGSPKVAGKPRFSVWNGIYFITSFDTEAKAVDHVAGLNAAYRGAHLPPADHYELLHTWAEAIGDGLLIRRRTIRVDHGVVSESVEIRTWIEGVTAVVNSEKEAMDALKPRRVSPRLR